MIVQLSETVALNPDHVVSIKVNSAKTGVLIKDIHEEEHRVGVVGKDHRLVLQGVIRRLNGTSTKPATKPEPRKKA